MKGSEPIRVLVVDDSALIRQMLTEILNQDPGLEVVGTASDPYVARDKIKRLRPHVLTLDVEMPRMDGITFLRNLMRLHPLPVVMVSSLTEAGAEATLEALASGAVDFVAKPGQISELDVYAEELIAKVKMAARVPVSRLERYSVSHRPLDGGGRCRSGVIAIGASTGGIEAISAILVRLPAEMPPIVVTQHIPATFSASFAKRLNQQCQLSVTEARDGEPIRSGRVYIAPGSHHLRIVRDRNGWRCRLGADDPVNRHRPSVDVLFESIARMVGVEALGILLTGMGKDGAQGLLAMRQAGARTIVQDEASSVVWGMPGAAVQCGAAEKVLPLERIAGAIRCWSSSQVSQ